MEIDAYGECRAKQHRRLRHRGIVGITSILDGKIVNDALSVSGMALLNQCLGKLGGGLPAGARTRGALRR